jgi:hypothetical protein
VGGDDAARGVQARPAALADLLRPEERVEDARGDRGVDAGPGVGDGDGEAVAVAAAGRRGGTSAGGLSLAAGERDPDIVS